MKWSPFILSSENKNEVILQNTLHGTIITIQKSELSKINETLKLLNDIEDSVDSKIVKLYEMEYIFGDDFDVKQNFFNAMRYDFSLDDFLSLHILPTTDCNFKCKYCYQSGIDQGSWFGESDVERIIRYVDNYISNNKPIRHSNVILHGGEPTLNWRFVEQLMSEIEKCYKKHEITYHSQIISNSYLLTPDKIEFLVNHNLNRIQITIDGVESVHDNRRMLKSGAGSFNVIIKNLKMMLENQAIKNVSVRINFDRENCDDVVDLIKYLSQNFDPNRISLSFGLVTNTVSGTSAASYVDECSFNKGEFPKYYLNYYKEARKLGFNVQEVYLESNFCTSKLKNGMIISSSGDIYRCLSMVGRIEHSVGNIEVEQYNLDTYYNDALYEHCFDKNCPLIPMCHAGCRFESFLAYDDINRVICKYDDIIELNKLLLSEVANELR